MRKEREGYGSVFAPGFKLFESHASVFLFLELFYWVAHSKEQ